MKLSARARYAARILLDLAIHDSESPVRTAKLSEHTEITVQFIEQIIRPLKKEGLIRSVRGANGGHILDASPDDITMGQIVRIMEGGINLTNCCSDPETCDRAETCRTRNAWVSASRALERELDNITLSDLMREERPAQSLLADDDSMS